MKTISKRFLKGGLAILLAVIMLFSSTITGLAAVVDVATTSYNVTSGHYIYLDNSVLGWTTSVIQVIIGHGTWSSCYKMTKISNTNLYYVKMPDWSGATELAFIGNSGEWGDEGNSPSHRKSYASKSTAVFKLTTNLSSSNVSFFVPNSANSSLTASVNNAAYSNMNKAQKAVVYTAAAGSSSYSENAAGGTVKVATYYLSSGKTSATATSATSSSSTASASANGVKTAQVTLTATPATGYNFVGWFDSTTATTAKSTSATYTYTCDGAAKTYYARFQQAGYSYTVTAGTGGTVSPTSGTATSVEITATPNDGYKFAGWETTNGSVANTSAAKTTFTITGNNAIANATFTPADYTVTLDVNGGTINSGNVTGYTYGDTVALPTDVTRAGHTFTGWLDDVTGEIVKSITSTTFGNKSYTAQWEINKYTITVNQTAGGTTKVGSTTITDTTGTATFDYGTTVTVVVTPSANYKITGISGAISSDESTSAVTKTFTVTADATINVNFALAGSCSVSFAQGNATKELVIGDTYTNVASTDSTYCKGSGSVNYSSNSTSVATVDANGKVTAVAPGTATITATCNTDTSASASYQVTVLEPTLTFDEITLDVNGTADADDYRNIGNTPKSNYTVTYTPITSGDVRITSAGAITAMAPTTGVTVTAKITCGSWSKTVTFPVAVNAPTLNFSPKAVNLIVGQTMTNAFTASADGNPTITIESGDKAVMTIDGDNKGTAVGKGSTTVTATFVYNDYYKPTATSNVLVDDPIVELPEDFTSLNLEFGDSTTTGEVQLSTNAAFSDVEAAPITVTTDNAKVATATVDADGKVTVTATGVGTANITAKFYGAEVTIPVKVTQYDPYEYIYVTDTQGWAKMNIYFWDGNASSTHASMIYIGRNDQNQRVFAYRFEKTKLPGKIIFKQGTGSSDWTNQTDDQTFDISTNNAWYIASCSNNRSTVGRWNLDITLPTVTVDDVVVPVGGTTTANAESDGASHTWTIADTSKATVSADGTTATVTGKAPGETTITVRAFIAKPEGWNSIASDQSTAYPYISSAATANVSVSDVLYTISAAVQTSNDGTTYVDSTAGGSVTVNGKDGIDTEVSHGTEAELVATANDGYRFYEWINVTNDSTPGTSSILKTAPVTGDLEYIAKFIKTYHVDIVKDDTIENITFNNVEWTEAYSVDVDVNATINFSVKPAQGYVFSHYVITDADGDTLGTIYPTDGGSAYSLTIDPEQYDSDITITPVTVPAYTASATACPNAGTSGCTATVNGETSVQLTEGATATFEAVADGNYDFIGWYNDADLTNLVSTDARYTVTMETEAVSLFARFVKKYHIQDTDNNTVATLVYDPDTDTYTATAAFSDHITVNSADGADILPAEVNVADGAHVGATVAGHFTSYLVTADTEDYDPTQPVTYTIVPNGDRAYKLNITLQEATKYNVYFIEHDTETLVDTKAQGATVTIPCSSTQDNMYLASATASPATDLTIGNNEITFEMPSQDIYITPEFLEYRYISFTDDTGLTIENLKGAYKQGEEVNITISPANGQVSIKGFDFDNEGLTATENADGTWTITGIMPADMDIAITPSVEAKFAVNSKQVAIGNYGTGVTSFATITMTDEDGNTLSEGAYVDPATSVTYKVTTVNSNYTFVGFYSDGACHQPIQIGVDSTSVTVNADTTVYALFARKQWMTFDQSKTTGDYVKELVYDPSIGAYTLTATLTSSDSSATAINIGAWFRVTNNTSKWTTAEGYHVFDKTKFTVNFNGNGYGATIGWATTDGSNSAWKLTTGAESGQTIKFILTPNGNESIDFSATTTKEGATIYLSSGSLTLPGTYSVESVFTTTGITVSDSGTLTHDPDGVTTNMEAYKKADIPAAQMIEFKTSLSGASAADYYVDSFMIYDILDESYTIVTPNTLGNNEYSGTVYVDSDCYIVPIFFHTEEYLAANKMKAVDIYFDATAIADTNWGPFVSVYSWGSGGNKYSGIWPGQLMIPTENGSSFYTQLEVPDAALGNTTSIPQGLQFMNYLYGSTTVPSKFAAGFGISLNTIQTYDYREPITLYEEEYDVITFVAKTSEDGYHGSKASGQSVVKTVTNTTNAKTAGYVYETLVCRDGVTPMDLTGQPIEGAVSNTPDYYVISRGDNSYDSNGTKYAGDNNFDADWAVDWYIFDKDGNYLAHTLSTAMWHYADGEDDATSELEDALGLADGVLDGKLVHITYEAPNNDGHQLCFDGQWYGNKLEDDVYANVMVGLVDENGNFVIDTLDPTNDADYGEGWLIAEEERDGYTVGEKYERLPISLDLGIASLTAATKEGYRFVGWYTEANGKYTKISDAYDYRTYINMNETYYAMFKELGESDVVINHLKYNNPDDPDIPSHGGVASMTVKVTNTKTSEVFISTPSNELSSISFPAEEGTEYKIEITTTPLMNGEFFAWYTDSETDDGTPTYEEILVEADMVGSKDMVQSEFIYTYDPDEPVKVINIYSDVTRVSNYANIFYKYLNRFGKWRTITVRDILLTDDECNGYEGNNYMSYVPTYKDVTIVDENGVTKVYNSVKAHAPNAEVTEVFDGVIEWRVEDMYLTTTASNVTVVAYQDTPDYTLTYDLGDGDTKIKTGKYNTLIEITAESKDAEGKPFSYWIDTETNDIVSYKTYYNYRLVNDRSIKAVYGDDTAPEWSIIIENVDKTREYQDISDFIYTDYLIAYHSKQNIRLDQDPAGIRFGLIVLRDNVYVDNSYPSQNYDEATLESRVRRVAEKATNMKDTANNTLFYHYDLTDKNITNFNRINYYLQYDNNYSEEVNGKTVYLRDYTYSAFAYLVDADGEIYISKVTDVDFYDEAVASVNQ